MLAWFSASLKITSSALVSAAITPTLHAKPEPKRSAASVPLNSASSCSSSRWRSVSPASERAARLPAPYCVERLVRRLDDARVGGEAEIVVRAEEQPLAARRSPRGRDGPKTRRSGPCSTTAGRGPPASRRESGSRPALTAPQHLAGPLAGELAVAERHGPVDDDVADAGREPVRLVGRTALATASSPSNTTTSAAAPARSTPRSVRPSRSAGRPVSRRTASAGVEQPLLLHHEAVEPGGPGVGAVEDRAGERAVRRERRRIGPGHAERMREASRCWASVWQWLITISRAVSGSAPQQQVADRVDRLLAALGGDRRDAPARVLGDDRVVEQDDPLPVAAGAEDALVALGSPHASPGRRAARPAAAGAPRARRAAARRGGRSCRKPRVHVEGDVEPRRGGGVDQPRGSARPSSGPLRGMRCETCSRASAARRRADRLLHRLRRAGVAPPRVRRVDARRASRSRGRGSAAPPRSRRAPARTRVRSSSPRRPASSASLEQPLSSAATRRAGPAGPPGRRRRAGAGRSARG